MTKAQTSKAGRIFLNNLSITIHRNKYLVYISFASVATKFSTNNFVNRMEGLSPDNMSSINKLIIIQYCIYHNIYRKHSAMMT